MPVLPLSEQNRRIFAEKLFLRAGALDPLTFLQTIVFSDRPQIVGYLRSHLGVTPMDFYAAVIRYCELSAWLEEPPLFINLLQPFALEPGTKALIDAIRKEGPCRGHLSEHYPYFVWRVAAELPLLGRRDTRVAGLTFDWVAQQGQQQGQRVLRVLGPPKSGKTFTLTFFQYLAAVQPQKVGVVYVDFADPEMVTQAAGAGIPIELHVARRMEEQVRRRRSDIQPPAETLALPGLPAPPLPLARELAYPFQPLTNLQQRARWARDLAGELVDQVLYRPNRTPTWWVVIFDNCEQAPAETHELVRQLVARAAGTDPASVEQADTGVLRVVLLGDSAALMPNPLFRPHLVEEDLGAPPLGEVEVKEYFTLLGAHCGVQLSEAQLQALADESLAQARAQVAADPALPWPQALARAVIERTKPLEALAAQKRSAP